MAKKGMARPDRTKTRKKNETDPVPEISGKAKSGREPANPMISGTSGSGMKVFHTERPIPSDVYPAIDTDLARDNIENDLTAADLQDL